MPKRSNRALSIVPLDIELERTVKANRRNKRAIVSGATSSGAQEESVSESTHETSSSSGSKTTANNTNRTLRDFGAPPPYEDVSGIAAPTTASNNYEFKANLITLIEGHQFSGAKHENPRAHLKQFLKYCNTIKANGVTPEYIRMSLFKFSLTRKALDWIHWLPPNSLTTWDQFTAAFLSKFIPLEKTVELRSNIATLMKSRMNLSTMHGRD
ncbi:Chromosome segregation in meiosis protein 3 [Bienertia sinuspersici]